MQLHRNIVCLLFTFFVSNFSISAATEQVYFKDNKWAFVEKNLIDELRNNENNGMISLSGGLATGIVSGFTCYILSNYILLPVIRLGSLYEGNIYAAIFFEFVNSSNGFLIGIISSVVSTLLYKKYLIKNVSKVNTNILKTFLNNYNPDLLELGLANNKLYLPDELCEIFDLLYAGYQKGGLDFLKKEGLNILEIIRGKVKYKINPKKYKKYKKYNKTKVVYINMP